MNSFFIKILSFLAQRDIQRILRELQTEDLKLMKQTPMGKLMIFHRSVGLQLRNEFRAGHYRALNGYCHRLIAERGEELSFDALSSVALELIWKTLQTQKD